MRIGRYLFITRSGTTLSNHFNTLLNSTLKLYKQIVLYSKIKWEKSKGLDFIQILQPGDLGFDENLVHRGSPSGDRFLANVLSKIEIKSFDSILDVGCSKGSALRVMHKFPFQRIDGLEISGVLSQIAESNFKRLNIKNIKVYNLDAQEFKHYKSYKYFYFYLLFVKIYYQK